jgi:type IV secretory pathway VirB10-like protein
MAENPHVPTGTPSVTDHRAVPAGVLPRAVQTWMMAGIAAAMLAIMLFVGRPKPPARSATPAPSAQLPSADRVREYQERLRALEAQAARDAQLAPDAAPTTFEEPDTPSPDPVDAERRRREYESLFASNVVLSRRPEAERPDTERTLTPRAPRTESEPSPPSIDDIADAAVRATVRAGPRDTPVVPEAAAVPESTAASTTQALNAAPASPRTEPISAVGPLHPMLEGTVIDAVLTNRLDGNMTAPVNCLVTNPIYSHSGRHVLIPSGARLLGQTKPVQVFGESRLAVTFHRLVMPDGSTYRLDQFMGLNQIGDAGLRDRVNQHYLSTFGAAAAVGLISGLAQYLGSAGLGGGDGDRTVVIAGGVGDATSQATMQVMNRFLNRLPTVTIREGHRVKVYLTNDLELPAYAAPALAGQF